MGFSNKIGTNWTLWNGRQDVVKIWPKFNVSMYTVLDEPYELILHGMYFIPNLMKLSDSNPQNIGIASTL